jgi:hypothetical protein
MFITIPSVALVRPLNDGVAGECDSSHAGLRSDPDGRWCAVARRVSFPSVTSRAEREIYQDEVKNVRVDLAEASGMIAVDNFTINVAIDSSEDRGSAIPRFGIANICGEGSGRHEDTENFQGSTAPRCASVFLCVLRVRWRADYFRGGRMQQQIR